MPHAVKRRSPFKGWHRAGTQYVRHADRTTRGYVLLVDRCPGLTVWRYRIVHRTIAGCVVIDRHVEPFPSASVACRKALAALRKLK